MIFCTPKNISFEVYTGFLMKPLKISLIYKLLTSIQENIWQVLSTWTKRKQDKQWGKCTSFSSKYCSILTKCVYIWSKVSLKMNFTSTFDGYPCIFKASIFRIIPGTTKIEICDTNGFQLIPIINEQFLEENIMKLHRN